MLRSGSHCIPRETAVAIPTTLTLIRVPGANGRVNAN